MRLNRKPAMEFVKRIETLFRTGTAGGLTDRQLLERFLERRGDDAQDAFATLVDRHGAMVLRVCRQILPSEEDAEDAAQATFLVLARRAPSISRRESLGCWLHGVARRVAANLRITHARRGKLERREGGLRAAAHVIDGDFEAIENQDDWARLHDELGSLPRSFRDPLILCYLDGLTQEQAAAQLRCPLGTVQSRLARARAKLKTRLEKRGVSLAPIFAGANQVGLQTCPAPSAWSEATVRLAMQFADGKGQAIAGAGAASVVLAEQIVRALVVAKLRLALAMILPLTLLISGAAAWAIHEPKTPPASVATPVLIAGNAEAPVAPEKAQPPQVDDVRTIRGIVRDEQGHPVAKAWIGDKVQLSEDTWSIFEPLDRIRERKEPFRDAQGKIVPAGTLGKYFELKDHEGKWRPLHPADVRRFQPPVVPAGLPPLPLEALDVSAETMAAIEKAKDVFQVRAAKGRLIMLPIRVSPPMPEMRSSANRTDSQGRFSIQAELSSPWRSSSIRFASTDFSQRAIAVVHGDDPDGPIEITLRPVRQVRAHVIVKSKVEPLENVAWRLFTVDQTLGKLDWAPLIRAEGEFWAAGWLGDPDTTDGGNGKRLLEMWMPAGHYKVNFSSDTLYSAVDVNVPAGNGPLELPDIELETRAWFRMLGEPAAEIEAVELAGSVAKLADYRGKVVVLVRWSSLHEPYQRFVARLADMQKRFKVQPLTILALHDATIKSVASLSERLRPLREQIGGDNTIRFLLERPSVDGEGRRTLPQLLEFGSGRTADIYETWANQITLVMDRDGKLVLACGPSSNDGYNFAVAKDGRFVFSEEFGGHEDELKTESQLGSLAAALEDLFGLPRSPLPKPARADRPADEEWRRVVFKGKVVDHDGKPVVGAKVANLNDFKWNNAVRTGPSGEFALDMAISWHFVSIKVEAAGFATEAFSLDLRSDPKDEPWAGLRVEPSGLIRGPLVLDPGVEVAGRVLKNGKPVVGVLMVLKAGKAHELGPPPPDLGSTPGGARTGTDGSFRISHVPAERDWRAYAQLGSLPDAGVLVPVGFQTTGDGTSVDIGELHVEKGRTLAGRIVCSDGKNAPAGLVLTVYSDELADSKLEQPVGPTGQFRFEGMLDGRIILNVVFPKGAVPYPYRLSGKNRCLDPQAPDRFEGQLDRDITDMTILLEPGIQPEVPHTGYLEVDQTALADFEDASAGPITGVPPRP